jgi:hypothetical protein
MMLSTMMHGPTASAISAEGLSAPTERPRHDAAADCNAKVVRNHPFPALLRPTKQRYKLNVKANFETRRKHLRCKG